ncbi:hypothetical protein RRS04_004952 [Klebsiella aerogenes]|uniref:hypothetical protein n=1 Tax=Klebsiella aerogenes TaxID=548 RepID=UPI00069C4CED|nr:hypothetical protein [Klebsiella aerogenes]ELI7202197.1 hypothetical protein [Klebsiella aerogenes]
MAEQKIERNNPFPDTSGHTVPVGEPGTGKTTTMSKMIFAKSDTSQMEKIYGAMSPEEREKLIQTILSNTKFRMNLKKN